MSRLARDLMRPAPLAIAPGTPLLEVLHLFVVGQISGAPVIDEAGTVLGVISRADLLRVVDQTFDDEVDAPAGGDEGAERLETWTAADALTPDPVWVTPDTPIARVAARMRTEGIHRVLVGEAGRLDGILTSFDLLQAIDAS